MKATGQRRLRTLHNWLGVFFAPGLIFFALSGVFQTLGLHESGPHRQPATPLIGVLASVHREGEAAWPAARSARPATPDGAAAAAPPAEDDEARSFPLFKIYAVLLSLSLLASAGASGG